jgi:hypothetical protein
MDQQDQMSQLCKDVGVLTEQGRWMAPKIENMEKTQALLANSHADLLISHKHLKWKVMALSASVAYLAHHGDNLISLAKAALFP